MDNTVSLRAVDYVVVALILLISLGIGVLFAMKDYRNFNRVEYLLGGRRMFILPAAFSLFATFTSGVSLIGIVTDIYLYGLMGIASFIGTGICYLFATYTIVPLLHPLRLTSIYEYLNLRFQSVIVTQIAVVIATFQTLCYMSVALLSPALALQTATDLPLWMSVGVVGFVGTVYTAIGGIKSVIWTDAFQTVIMLGGVLTIIIKGIAIVGGGEALWNIISAGNRTVINDFSIDPRNRNTWWGGTLGVSFMWLGTIYNQSTLLRISSTKSVKAAKITFLINAVLVFVLGVLMAAIAWVTYAYFVHIRCDPYKAGLIGNANQLTPYYVMHAMKDLPGFGGLYMAVIFSASLSTISSGISALAANTVEDVLKKPIKNVQERTATLITQVFVFLYGIISIGLAFGANYIKGSLSQIFGVSVGGIGGPISGIFLLGALFPLANKYGALIGGAISIIFNVWIVMGSQINEAFEKPLQHPPTDMCFANNSDTNFKDYNNTKLYSVNETYFSKFNATGILISDVEGGSRKYGFFLYDISYEWYGMIGTLNSLFLGMLISYCTRKYCTSTPDEKLLFPFVRRFSLAQKPRTKDEVNGEDTNKLSMLANCAI